MSRFVLVVAVLLFFTQAWAVEVEGVNVPDTIQVSGKTLQLNGAGIRTKFFFDIYVGALYLSRSATTTEQVLKASGPKRITMTFLYGEVGRGKLVDGWNEGFGKNQSREAMGELKARLEKFNAMFGDARKGENYSFDFLPDGTTVVTFNGKQVGMVSGGDFQKALIEVWLGSHPAHDGLKKAMLSGGVR